MPEDRDYPRPLTLSSVQHVEAEGKYYDGTAGLMLVVSSGGSKQWVQRLTVDGRRRDLGLGSADTLTPAQARGIARKNRETARRGGNPTLEMGAGPAKEAPSVRTSHLFAGFAANHYRSVAKAPGKAEAAREDYRRIREYLTPKLGRRPMAGITTQEIAAELGEIGRLVPSVAKMLRPRLVEIFDRAVREGLRPDNPAASPETVIHPAPKRTTQEGDARNRRILAALPGLLRAMETSEARPILMRMLRFMLLTLRAPQECRLATWDQIDLKARLWRFPSMQREGAKPVEFQLLDAHMAILDEMGPLARGDGRGLVFPNTVSLEAYTANAFHKALDVFDLDVTVLDFRRAHEFWLRATARTDEDLEGWVARLRDGGFKDVPRGPGTGTPATRGLAQVKVLPRVAEVRDGDRMARILESLPGIHATLRARLHVPLMRPVLFMLLTARAPQECRLARWEQIDLSAGRWRFPSMQRDDMPLVEVELLDAHMEVIEAARSLSANDGAGFVFLSPRERAPYSDSAMLRATKEVGAGITPLDFGRAYRVWAANAALEQGETQGLWVRYLG